MQPQATRRRAISSLWWFPPDRHRFTHSVRTPSRLRGLFQEKEMNISNLLTVEAVQVTLAARQAQREFDAAIVVAEIALRERAQKNRPARQHRTASLAME